MSVIDEWASKNPESEAHFRRASRVMVDGVTQDVRAEPPFPVAMAGSSGYMVETVDGHELICYVMGHGSLLLGHAYQPVIEAVQSQAARSLHYGGSHPGEAEWAERIVDLVPSAERVRFTSSGTETTMLACRVARAITGRQAILKVNGHFHGWHDSVVRGFTVPFDRPFAGVLDAGTESIEPDGDALEARLKRGDVAAVIVEPAGGYSGAVPVPQEFVELARQVCTATDTVLIFDEVVTGFRWAPGGAQETLGILPDLTTLGKIVAGGLAGGALTGDSAMMGLLGVASGERKVIHTGTHNGHPLAAAAGAATLQAIQDGGPQQSATQSCRALVDGFNRVLEIQDVAGLAYGASSHFCILLGVPEVKGVKDAADLSSAVLRKGTPPDVLAALNCAMMLNGVHLFHGHGFVSAVHDSDSTTRTVEAFAASVERLVAEGVL